ncbi:MAG TPA: CbtB-domain containing protein [Stellaceae bacterium]
MAHTSPPDINRDHAINVTASRIIPAGIALLVGAFVLLGAGFAPIRAIHNAAHDARHSFAFPCH